MDALRLILGRTSAPQQRWHCSQKQPGEKVNVPAMVEIHTSSRNQRPLCVERNSFLFSFLCGRVSSTLLDITARYSRVRERAPSLSFYISVWRLRSCGRFSSPLLTFQRGGPGPARRSRETARGSSNIAPGCKHTTSSDSKRQMSRPPSPTKMSSSPVAPTS